ncbi:MDR family MFS transporter [Paenibacillus gansuensis]|uniref:MDR family MFS transporter n=1 Tax=Paenibacillus gansuensis TaxID=306542 RepID=A0ABW5PG54_9BACL
MDTEGRWRAMKKLSNPLKGFHPIVQMLLAGTVFARAASSMSLPFLAIYLAKYTDMDPFMIGLTIGLGSLAGTLGGFFGGHLSDRFGRRLVMLSAVYLWGIVFIGFAFSTAAWLLALLNILNGLCRSWYEPVSQALMADITEKEKRFKVFSLRYMAINIGVSVGPLMGAAFALVNGKLPWLVTGVFYLMYAVTLQLLLNRFGIRDIEGEKKEGASLKAAWNVIRLDKAFRYLTLGNILVAIGYSQMTSTLSQFIGDHFRDGTALFAWMMSINAITVIVFQLPMAKWAEKRTPLMAIAVGNLFYALGDVGYAFSSSWWAMILSMIVFTWGEILTFPAGTVLVDRIAPEGMRGTYYGAQQFSSLGHFAGPWLGGFLLQGYGGPTLFIAVAVISVVSILFYRSGERIQERKLASAQGPGLSA